MTTGSSTDSDLLALFDELVLDGREPNAENFCARYPDRPGLLERIRALERLRDDLRRLARHTAPPPTDSPPDLDGFRILEPLGQGGMGTVYLAEQESPRRLCALKLINHSSPAALERFKREADLAARLDHPGIATVYASGVQNGCAFLATEYVHGFSLRDLLLTADLVAPGDGGSWIVEALQHVSAGIGGSSKPSSPGPVSTMVALATQIAEALAHAHERGVIHRDVKPSNVMVTFDGTAKLIDFGIAVGDDITVDRVTRTGAFIGSHDFAAPEQLRGETNAIGSWTDTYALGATLYEMLTLHTPFESATFADRLAQVDEPPPYTPRHYNARVPSALDSLVSRALHPIADRRFHDGREIGEALIACPTQTSLLPMFSLGWLRRLGIVTRAHVVALLACIVAVVFAGLNVSDRAQTLERQERAARNARRSAQQVLNWQLEIVRGEFEACLPPHTIARNLRRPLLPLIPPSRMEATLTVVRGEVRKVEPTGSYGVSPRAGTCLVDTLRNMRLPGVGFGEPMSLTVNLRVKPATASISP